MGIHVIGENAPHAGSMFNNTTGLKQKNRLKKVVYLLGSLSSQKYSMLKDFGD